MPIYDYVCDNCQKPFTVVLSLAEYEKGKVECPKCGSKNVHQEISECTVVTSRKS
jgi:putative FmdB family regulatory protein